MWEGNENWGRTKQTDEHEKTDQTKETLLPLLLGIDILTMCFSRANHYWAMEEKNL
jgi:hypothetical protein